MLERVAGGLDPTAPLGARWLPTPTPGRRVGAGQRAGPVGAPTGPCARPTAPPNRCRRPGAQPHGADDTFVIQEHHARRLHWDLRLERAGVLVSWAVPRGIPENSGDNRLAVHTEDHPLEYAAFSGTIPAGEYGGGEMTIWDSGTYETEKWWSDEVIVRFHGGKVQGRYVIVRTDGKNWLLRRMKDQQGRWVPHPEPASRRARIPDSDALTGSRVPTAGSPADDDADGGPAPDDARPAGARPGADAGSARADPARPNPTCLPHRPISRRCWPPRAPSTNSVGDDWRFEGKWDGIRALAAVGNGDAAADQPDRPRHHRRLPRAGRADRAHRRAHAVVLDGEIVALDDDGRTDFGLLQQRMGLTRKADVEPGPDQGAGALLRVRHPLAGRGFVGAARVRRPSPAVDRTEPAGRRRSRCPSR